VNPEPIGVEGTTPIGELRWRETGRVCGRIRSMRIHPVAGVTTLECVVVDESGGLYAVFPKRRAVEGVGLGRDLVLEGVVESYRGSLAMVDPRIVAEEESDAAGA
jgi:hypothetical protein